jgi:hypothetical protein
MLMVITTILKIREKLKRDESAQSKAIEGDLV